ncbi:interleukin-17 receptor C [Protopterus annectens]|uniref:interleukin-17 receptor C n=1 Tax=Protopterus annectens TaxID=7888 RepID=UPI001CFB41A5|nr:interleukin-17 receptor C [Protopterus annectens]
MSYSSIFIIICIELFTRGWTLEKVANLSIQCSEGFVCDTDYNDAVANTGIKVPPDKMAIVPTSMSVDTVLFCPPKQKCSLCVRVHLNLSIIGPTEFNNQNPTKRSLDERDYSGDDDDDDDDGEGYEENQDDDGSDLEIKVEESGSGYILPGHVQQKLYVCVTDPETRCMKATVDFTPPEDGIANDTRVEGMLEYSCFKTVTSKELHIKAFADPLNKDPLETTYKVQDCSEPTLKDYMEECEVTDIKVTINESDRTALIHSVNSKKNFDLQQYYNVEPTWSPSKHFANVSEVPIPFSDIVPCLCIRAWPPHIIDAIRVEKCPFKQEPGFVENVKNQSRLEVKVVNKIIAWRVWAPCNIPVEVQLRWYPTNNERTLQGAPIFSRHAEVNKLNEFLGVRNHKYLCIQAVSEGKIIGTECPFRGNNSDLQPHWKNIAVVRTNSNSSCLVRGNNCTPITNSSMNSFLEKQVLHDFRSGKCLQVFKNDIYEFHACSAEYSRHHFHLLIIVCLLLPVLGILAAVLNRRSCKDWLKRLRGNCTVEGVFTNKNILILCSPECNVNDTLVNKFASCLLEMRFFVVTDIWKKIQLSNMGSLQWLHAQKRKIMEHNGKIVIILSHAAVAKYKEWCCPKGGIRGQEDPADSFMASLNCIMPDIIEGKMLENYVAVYFEELLDKKDIPQIFRQISIFNLPSQLSGFLVEIAKPSRVKTYGRVFKKQSSKMKHELQPLIKACGDLQRSSWYKDYCRLEEQLQQLASSDIA